MAELEDAGLAISVTGTAHDRDLSFNRRWSSEEVDGFLRKHFVRLFEILDAAPPEFNATGESIAPYFLLLKERSKVCIVHKAVTGASCAFHMSKGNTGNTYVYFGTRRTLELDDDSGEYVLAEQSVALGKKPITNPGKRAFPLFLWDDDDDKAIMGGGAGLTLTVSAYNLIQSGEAPSHSGPHVLVSLSDYGAYLASVGSSGNATNTATNTNAFASTSGTTASDNFTSGMSISGMLTHGPSASSLSASAGPSTSGPSASAGPSTSGPSASGTSTSAHSTSGSSLILGSTGGTNFIDLTTRRLQRRRSARNRMV
ncbi:hypothetical protein PLICRDRAFT_57541 [Plicaturopsis crispa FD-325 SS-3]|uniref:Uncharacterized protein n=1 Tax=Plicaturopsis crispa FD-325 SS-3 TaxID=944288 RepID=A0A0C9T8L3_PLICR|nr:hypothetical protein PLICRDRAFT_57541 [Plicaturopsis crispa FD-325 SS-3]